MKCKDWFNFWLENYVRPSAKERTYIKYADIVRVRIIPVLGEYELEELTPLILQKFITELLEHGNSKTEGGLAVNTVNSTVNVLRNSLKTANSVGVLKEYTADCVRRPRPKEKQVECFTSEEQKKIEEYILGNKKTKYYGIVLTLYTGLRVGELMALTWKDIDFQKNLLTVNKSCFDGKDEKGNFLRLTGGTKTESSNRIIPLAPKIVAMLRQMKKAAKTEFVVESKSQKIIAVRSYQLSFELILKKLHIPHKGFHALRHTFATRAVECGMDVKTLAEILGHKDPGVTLKRYVHSMMDHKREMMNKVAKLLQAG